MWLQASPVIHRNHVVRQLAEDHVVESGWGHLVITRVWPTIVEELEGGHAPSPTNGEFRWSMLRLPTMR